MNGEKIFRQIVTDERAVLHTSRVVEMCVCFADGMNLTSAERELLINCAWLHDVAKAEFGEAHNLPDNVKKIINDASISDDIYHVIYNHKNEFEPRKELSLICSILRICDKLDKFNKKSSDASVKCESSLKLIENKLTPEVFERFRAIYNEIYFTKIE